ncbi:MAG: aspartate aminotransferase family protein [Sphingobacteriales bacterium]|jgi:acetylornithine/succinyldiaminopimelate/putrescine aminotransferase|nr:aspartate aminotransferase family protein [Sphingobacteriales bacterium]OJW30657.1 MAG: aspartate aminotransferase family protein [Sphingobacteriales bacterium 46-32]
MNQRELFLRHVGQTSPAPLALEIVKAEKSSLWDASGREYIDLIGGISVANTGHRHPRVLAAIHAQLDAYMHIMVYGEFVESPQVQYAHLLTQHLPAPLNMVYFTNSGAEAVEGAMKLAKRATGRTEIIAFNNSYHGSTQGALSIIGDEYWRQAYRPLLPGIRHLTYNSAAAIDAITRRTACVIVETVQAEAGVKAPSPEWMKALRQRCSDTGTLLVMDEIQTGFGRTGRLWGFEHFGVVPDIVLLGKALGGGMPLGAFAADRELMMTLTDGPVLGHITTFGGHPVSCAAGRAALQVLLDEQLMNGITEKEQLFRTLLKHTAIKNITSFGLWLAISFDSFETNKRIIDACIDRGILTDWFLFSAESLRISPPLTITDAEIRKACAVILEAIELAHAV